MLTIKIMFISVTFLFFILLQLVILKAHILVFCHDRSIDVRSRRLRLPKLSELRVITQGPSS